MIFSKVFPVKIHALHLEISGNEFRNEWKKCVEDKKYDKTSLVLALEPFITHWFNLLTNTEYPRDIQIAGLCQNLDNESQDGLEIIREWLLTIDDLKQELRYIVMKTICAKRFPYSVKPIVVEYIFAFIFRGHLRNTIVRSKKTPYELTGKPEILDIPIEPSYEDWFLTERVPQDAWEEYLFFLIQNGFNAVEIAKITKIPRETFYYEEQRVWQRIIHLNQSPIKKQ